MNRVLLINKTKSPTRQELMTSERAAGDLFFAQHNLQWGGYSILQGNGKKCANWVIDDEALGNLLAFVGKHELDGYEVAVFANGINKFGGQTEVRVF